MPAATAQVLTAKPGLGLAISVGIGLFATWIGLAWAFFGAQSTGFTITTLAFGCYLLALGVRALLGARSRSGAPRIAALEGVS
jgi:zinc/manganese transport system permease protein